MAAWTDISTISSYFNRVGTQVSVLGTGGGSGAVVYAVVSSGVITGLNLISGGSGYSGTISVLIIGSGSGATATATQSGGAINAVTLGTGGSGYQGTAPAWTLNVQANAWDVLLGFLGNWPAGVNANQQSLSNLLTLGLIPAANTGALNIDPPALTGAGTQTGARLRMRANSWDTANHTRDFAWQPSTSDNAGDGILALLTRLDGGTYASVLTVDQAGNLSTNTAALVKSSVTSAATYANSDLSQVQFYQATNYPTTSAFQRVLDIFAGGSNAGSNIRLLTQGASGAAVVGLTIDLNQDVAIPNGFLGIGTSAPKSPVHAVGIPTYANNAAAITGGLTAGAFYRTGGNPDPVCVVH